MPLVMLIAAALQSFDHSTFTAVLARHATPDGVRYAALQQERAPLDAYVRALARVPAGEFDSWSRPEQIAYLINAYNALVLTQVLDHYPIKRSLHPAALIRPANSVWQISGFFDGIRHRVAGRELTLDDIEHRWLREKLKEPRIHAALVCAAESCPPLRPEAFVAQRLDSQLDDQVRRFLADRGKNRIERARGTVQLSEIFKWFGEDFHLYSAASAYAGSAAERGVLGFLAQYLGSDDATWLRSGKLKLSFIDYNWTLNEAR